MTDTPRPDAPGEETRKLAPCPFCGGSADVWERSIPGGEEGEQEYGWRVGCAGDDGWCVANLDRYHNTREDAIAAWNRRTTASGQAASVQGAEPRLDRETIARILRWCWHKTRDSKASKALLREPASAPYLREADFALANLGAPLPGEGGKP